MSSWLQRFRGGAEIPPQRQTTYPPARKRRGSFNASPKDPNVPLKHLQIHQRCLYERTLPGNAFISAHVSRLQHGFYESSALHEPVMDNVYFVSVHFVFHPQDPRSHRFKSAEIQVSVHGDEGNPAAAGYPRSRPSTSHPRILKHAPELMFGAVSPENLQWNFSLSSSLGVSQAPVSATLNPQGGMKSSYKLFHMMSIQGSVRSKRSILGPEHDVEDARAIWTLEENMLQRSGLPREFDFVLLIEKPDDVKSMYLSVDVDADIESWFGKYPKWYTNMSRYMPTQDFTLDFNANIGQRFVPSVPGRGFNFSSLSHSLDEYVAMPGTVYPTNDTKQEDNTTSTSEGRKRSDWKLTEHGKAAPTSPRHPQGDELIPSPTRERTSRQRQMQGYQNRNSWTPENVNVRVVLEHQYPQSVDPRRFSYSPSSNPGPERYPSIRRRKSRSGLKEYGAKQALHELAQHALGEGKILVGEVGEQK